MPYGAVLKVQDGAHAKSGSLLFDWDPYNTLIITRSSEWNNRMRAISIYLDGKKLGTISNGETKSFEVDPGTHQLKARIDWCNSPEIPFIADENEKKYFRLSSSRYANILMPFTLVLLVLCYSFLAPGCRVGPYPFRISRCKESVCFNPLPFARTLGRHFQFAFRSTRKNTLSLYYG